MEIQSVERERRECELLSEWLHPARGTASETQSGLFSLAEIMNSFPAAHLSSWLILATQFGSPTRKNPDDLVPQAMLLRNIDEMLALFSGWPLDSATDELHRIRSKLRIGGVRWDQYEPLMDSLRRRIQFELARHLFLLVPREKARRMGTEPGFTGGTQMGREVLARFPGVMFDIHHAYWCWALDLHTACVFHLMRVVEAGLREIGASLRVKIKDRPTWNDYIQAIENRLRPQGKKRTMSRAMEVFYSGAASQIREISKAWRNPVVHEIATRYEEHQATQILNHIEALMQSIVRDLPPRKVGGQMGSVKR